MCAAQLPSAVFSTPCTSSQAWSSVLPPPTIECSQSRFCGSYHRDSASHVNAVRYTFTWVCQRRCVVYAILVVRTRRPIIDCWISRCSRHLQTPCTYCTASTSFAESGLRGHHADRAPQASDASSLWRAAERKSLGTASRESRRTMHHESAVRQPFAARMYGAA